VFGPDININREYIGPGLFDKLDNQNFGNRALYSFAQNMFFGNGRDYIQPLDAPTERGGKFADALGAGAAVGADFALTAPVAALAAGALPARLAPAIAGAMTKAKVPVALANRLAPGVIQTPMTFAGQAALSGEDPAKAAMMGLAFSLLPGAPVVRNIAANPVGAQAVNIGALTALNKAEGLPWGESISNAVATDIGLKIGNAMVGPQPGLRRSPAEMELANVERAQKLAEIERQIAAAEGQASIKDMSAQQEAARRAALMESTPVEPQMVRPPSEISDAALQRLIASRVRAADAEVTAQREALRAQADQAAPDMGGMPGTGSGIGLERRAEIMAMEEQARIAEERGLVMPQEPRPIPTNEQLGIRWRDGAAQEQPPAAVLPAQGPVDAVRDQYGRPILPPEKDSRPLEVPTIIEPKKEAPAPQPDPEPARGPNNLVDQRGWPSAGAEAEAPRRGPQEIVVDGVRYQPVLSEQDRTLALREAPKRSEPAPPTLIEATQPPNVSPSGLVDSRGWPSAGTAVEAPKRNLSVVAPDAPRTTDAPNLSATAPSRIIDPTAPNPRRRGDIQLGSGLGGGGEAWKFKELRGAISEAGRRLGTALSTSDAKIAEGLLKAYTPGQKDSEFMAMPGVREALMKSDSPNEVWAMFKDAAANRPDPTTPPSGGRGRTPLKPAKNATVASLREASTKPRANNKVSEAVQPFLNGEADVPTMAGNLGKTGAVTERAKELEIRKKLRAERDAAKQKAKDAGEKFDTRGYYGGRTVKQEAEYRILKEELDPNFATYSAEQRDARDGGGKSNLDISVDRAKLHNEAYVLQGMGGGEVGAKNPLDNLIRTTEDSRSISNKYTDDVSIRADQLLKKHGIKLGDKDGALVGPFIEAAKDTPLDQFAATPEGQKILAGAKNPTKVVEVAKEVADIYETVLNDHNAVAEAIGEPKMNRLDGYFSKYGKRPSWWRIDQKIAESYRGPEGSTTWYPSLEPSGTAKKSDSHVKHRTGREINRDWDLTRNLHRYIAEEGSFIGGAVGIHNAYKYAKLLEYDGHTNAARIIRDYAQSTFNRAESGVMNPLDRLVTQGGVPNVIGDYFKWNYDRLADAMFTLNIPWNIIVQPSSAGFVTAAGSPKDSIKGAAIKMSPEFRKFVDEQVFSRKIKGRSGGSVGDIGQSEKVTGTDTGLTKLKKKGQFVNEVIEREIDYYAAAVGMEHGKRLGLEGRELTDFMSDYIRKTQDVYHRQDRPMAVRSKAFNVAFPFMGYAFNAKSNLQENLGIGRRGAYKIRPTVQSRAWYGARLAISGAVAGAIGKMIANRDELYGPSMLPMYDVLTGGGPGKGMLGPANVYAGDMKMFKDIADGKYGPALASGIRRRVPFGRMVSDLLMADYFLEDPRAPFQLQEDEYPQALVFGVWSTPSGKKYLEELKKRDPSLLERIMDTGEEEPTTYGRQLNTRSTRGREAARPRELTRRKMN
jgi:hypothetical protein